MASYQHQRTLIHRKKKLDEESKRKLEQKYHFTYFFIILLIFPLHIFLRLSLCNCKWKNDAKMNFLSIFHLWVPFIYFWWHHVWYSTVIDCKVYIACARKEYDGDLRTPTPRENWKMLRNYIKFQSVHSTMILKKFF